MNAPSAGTTTRGTQKGRPRCRATTKRGLRCSNPAKASSTQCGTHAGNIGRRSKFTPDVTAQIIRRIEVGVPTKVAAAAAGVGETTFYRWLRDGQRDDEDGIESELAAFSAACRRARADGHVRLVALAQKAAEADGRLALEMLSRGWPEHWGKKNTLEHQGSINATVTLPTEEQREQLERLSDEELEEYYRLRLIMEGKR